MELTRPPLTRLTAQLVDRDQERSFRAYNLQSQRRTALAVLVVILVANGVVAAHSLLVEPGGATTMRVASPLLATVMGAPLVWGLARPRSDRAMLALVSGSVFLLSALVAAVLTAGPNMGFRGAILVIGGIAVIYLTVPLHLKAVTALALIYSAVTIPLWLAQAQASLEIDVPYALMAVVLAHMLSFVEARRAQQERRVLFAQRDMLLSLSSIDPLTGLMNRRAVDAELSRAWRIWQQSGVSLAVVMIDIDHFKTLNDSQGHIAGDHALRLVSDVIRGAMPLVPGQVAARYGGEEFICVLPGLDAAAATVVAGRILAGVRRIALPLTAAQDSAGILTVSAGVAAAGAAIRRAEDLVAAADTQLYRAKREGRNCVRTASLVTARAGIPLQR